MIFFFIRVYKISVSYTVKLMIVQYVFYDLIN